ncbi:MAG: hypothetical protein GYB65_21160 [Chloroflexi bacterium]|nr:hypothetical protein [Chloroflexota bacterium]
MDPKQMCVANVKYKKPTPDDTKRTKGLLRYLTYRDSRDGHIKQTGGRERWVDHGLGSTVGEIADTCEQYRSEHVLAFTLVFNANPDLIAMVPEKRRARFVRELNETTLDRFLEARGIEGGIEHSYVLHHRASEDRQSPGMHNPHTHLILPGTYFDEDLGERVPLFFSRNKKVNHIEMLHDVTEQTMREQMERYVGPEWEQRYDRIATVREQQREVTVREPDGVFVDEQDQAWPVWGGVRRTTEDTSAAGFYRHFQAKDGPSLEFRPLLLNMPHEMADEVGNMFAAHLRSYPDPTLKQLHDFSEQLYVEMTSGNEEQATLSQILDDKPEPDHEPEILLDL